MKHRMIVFNAKGDTAVAEWEEQDVESVERARGTFEAAKDEGWAAVTATEGGSSTVEKFQPELEEIVLLRPISGG